MATKDEIYQKVSATLVEALHVDDDEVKPDSTLQGDLGAESIDFLDIVFRLEREFAISIPRGELFVEPILQGESEIVRDGRLTPEGLVALRSQMPYADLSGLERDRRLGAVADLFTVDLLVRYVTWKLGGEGASSESD